MRIGVSHVISLGLIGLLAACTQPPSQEQPQQEQPQVVPETQNESFVARAEVASFIDELVQDHGFAKPYLTQLFAQTTHNPEIIELISKPAEKRLVWHEYADLLVDDERIDLGVQFWRDNASVLARAYQQYGVAPEYVVAIIGIETKYGRVMGRHKVLQALATLGFDYPPRADFFRSELTQFLLLTREEGKDPRELLGSYAGAMGYGQFIASSYRNFAVDFDADGVRDIWNNKVDAIGSVANYFSVHGWRDKAPVVAKVQVTDKVTDAEVEHLSELADGGLEPYLKVGQLRAKGMVVDGFQHDIADDAQASLWQMESQSGPEFWLGLHNFYVITRYNRSQLYARAVHELSQAIRERHAQRLPSV